MKAPRVSYLAVRPLDLKAHGANLAGRRVRKGEVLALIVVSDTPLGRVVDLRGQVYFWPSHAYRALSPLTT